MIFPRIAWLMAGVVLFAGSASAQFPGSKKNRPAKPEPAARNAIHAGAYLELGPLLGNVTSSNATVWLKTSGETSLA